MEKKTIFIYDFVKYLNYCIFGGNRGTQYLEL